MIPEIPLVYEPGIVHKALPHSFLVILTAGVSGREEKEAPRIAGLLLVKAAAKAGLDPRLGDATTEHGHGHPPPKQL